MSAVSFTPTSRINWANTVFTDLAVASLIVIAGPPSPSAAFLIGLHDVPLQPGGTYEFGAGYTLFGVTPLAKAAARVNALNDDPGCRPPPPPLTVFPSQQVAATSTL